MDVTADFLRMILREDGPALEPNAVTLPAGDSWESAWIETVDELAGLVRALGVRGDRRHDVLQDVYLAMRQKGPANLVGDEPRRWLFRVTANRCRLEHRLRNRWKALFDRLATRTRRASEGIGKSAEQSELTAQVDAALARLKTVEREVVVLRYFCGLNSREVGEVLEMPEGTVRSHLAKARRQLARDLAEFGNED